MEKRRGVVTAGGRAVGMRSAKHRPARRGGNTGKGHAGNTSKDYHDAKLLGGIYADFDVDGNGQVSIDELRAGLAAMGSGAITRHFMGMFDSLDADRSGTISFSELLKSLNKNKSNEQIADLVTHVFPPKVKPPTPEPPQLSDEQVEEIKQIFYLYDSDGNGSLSLRELKDALVSTAITEEEVEQMFKQWDADENLVITMDEFLEGMASDM